MSKHTKGRRENRASHDLMLKLFGDESSQLTGQLQVQSPIDKQTKALALMNSYCGTHARLIDSQLYTVNNKTLIILEYFNFHVL